MIATVSKFIIAVHQKLSFTRFLLIVVGCCIGLLLVEAFLRMSWDNPYEVIERGEIVELRMNAPNVDFSLDRSWLDGKKVKFRTDNRRYILPSRLHEDPQVTIAFMGGSTTEALYVAETMRFHYLVAMILENNGHRVNVLNAGEGGTTVQDTLNTYLNHVVQDDPDIVIMMHATNDRSLLASDPTYFSRSGQVISLSKQSRWIIHELSSKISSIGLLRQANFRSVKKKSSLRNYIDESELLISPDPKPYIQRVESFVDIVRNFGSIPVLMTQPLDSTRHPVRPDLENMNGQERFNDIIRTIASDKNVVLVDLEDHMRDIPEFAADPTEFLYDGMHITDKGSTIYAKMIASVLLADIVR